MWPALRVVLKEFVSLQDARHLLAAATVSPSLFRECWVLNDLLHICDSYFDEHSPYSNAAELLREKETQISHLFTELIRKVDTFDEPSVARARLEEVAARLHFYIVGNTVVPIELQVPQEITTLPDAPLAALQKASKRYRDGDLDGAMAAICAAVDGACEELVGGSIDKWNELNYVQKVRLAHEPCMARLEAAAGLPPTDLKVVVDASKRSLLAAAEILARFRREYSDTHGPSKAPAPLVQVAFDSAVYLLRVLAPRQDT